MDENTIQLVNFNNSSWEYAKDHIETMEEFFSTYEKSQEVAKLIVLSVKLVLSELMLKRDIYSKYPAKVYTEEDFVNMVIESMETNAPNADDLKANDAYFNDMRSIMWGHIKTRAQRLADVLVAVDREGTADGIVSDDDGVAFIECLMVVWTECILRKRESQLLERAYGK